MKTRVLIPLEYKDKYLEKENLELKKQNLVYEVLPLEDIIDEAILCLKNKNLVALATETVYGLAAIADSNEAVNKIYEVKKRASDNPLIVHVANYNKLEEITHIETKLVKFLAETYMPGPLSLVLPAKEGKIATKVSAGLDTLAVRIPDNEIFNKILKKVTLRWLLPPLISLVNQAPLE